MPRLLSMAARLFFAISVGLLIYSEGLASVSAPQGESDSISLQNKAADVNTIQLDSDAAGAEIGTPLEEIEQEEVLPEDFFDLQTLDDSVKLSKSLPPLSLHPENPISPEMTYDIPIVLNDLVTNYITFFQTRLRDRFEEWLARSGSYIPMMQQILKQHQLPEDLVFLALIESGFNPKAFSRAKAAGPWQFIKGTGKKYGLRIDQWIDERRDPVKSTVAAARYLKDLYGMFGSWPLSMASYNAGEGRIMRAMARTKAEDFWGLNSSSLRPETKNYVPKFMAATIIAKEPEKYGFFIDYHPPLAYDEVEISKPVSFKTVAKAAGVSVADIKAYNPELKKEMTPPKYPRYRLKLPPGAKERFVANFSPKTEKEIVITDAQKHRVQRGETISSISRKYEVSVNRILEANQLDRDSVIQAGRVLLIPGGN